MLPCRFWSKMSSINKIGIEVSCIQRTGKCTCLPIIHSIISQLSLSLLETQYVNFMATYSTLYKTEWKYLKFCMCTKNDIGCGLNSFKTFMFFHIFHSANPCSLWVCQWLLKNKKDRKCESGIAFIVSHRRIQELRGGEISPSDVQPLVLNAMTSLGKDDRQAFVLSNNSFESHRRPDQWDQRLYRVLDQHGGPPGRPEESDPEGAILYGMAGCPDRSCLAASWWNFQLLLRVYRKSTQASVMSYITQRRHGLVP